jgi:predicted Na+-dependent transporter
MNILILIVVAILMISVGLSLDLKEISATIRRLTWLAWLRLLLATFIIPAFLALALGNAFRLGRGELAGIFLVGAAPGAPLLTRNLSRKGFDTHLAATYQLWAAIMIPIMIPLIVLVAGQFYHRVIWVPPTELLWQIVEKQVIPLAVGMALARLAPRVAKKVQAPLNMLGNVLLTAFLVLILWKLEPELMRTSPMVPVVALLLALGCMLAVWLMRLKDPVIQETFAISNTNRHAGLALLLSGKYVRAEHAIPAIACYALVAALVMIVYARLTRSKGRTASDTGDRLVTS